MPDKKESKDKINIVRVLTVIAVIIITYFQLHGFFYFLEEGTNHWIMVVAMLVPLLFMNGYFVKSFTKARHTVGEIIGLLALSVAFYVGIFLPYLNSFAMDYIKAVIGYIAFFFVMVYMANELLLKAEWTYKSRNPGIVRFLIYFIIPASVYAIFMAACYPGLSSPDSLYILNRAAAGGPYDNLSPLLYTLFIRILTVAGLKYGGIMILQCLMCALAYAYIVYSFDKMGLPIIFCIIGTILLTIYPLNLMNTITMWKDIPYTIGLSLIVLELVKLTVDDEYFKKNMNIAVLVFALIITLVARHNGILTVVLTFLIGSIFYLIKKNKGYAIKFAIILISSLVFYYGALYGSIALLGDKYQEPEDNQVTKTSFYATRIQGLVALYNDKWDVLSQDNKEYIDKYIDLEKLDEHIETYSDTWRYRSRTKIYVDADALLSSKSDFNKGYISLLKEYPFDLINAYLKTTGIVWSAPDYGYTMHAAYTYNLEDTSAYEAIEIPQKSYLPKFKDYILLEIFLKSADLKFYSLYWRPAIFMLVMLLFLYHALRKKRYIAWLIAAPAIINSLGYLVVNEAQDARYVYINFTAALIIIAFAMMKDKGDSVSDDKAIEE